MGFEVETPGNTGLRLSFPSVLANRAETTESDEFHTIWETREPGKNQEDFEQFFTVVINFTDNLRVETR